APHPLSRQRLRGLGVPAYPRSPRRRDGDVSGQAGGVIMRKINTARLKRQVTKLEIKVRQAEDAMDPKASLDAQVAQIRARENAEVELMDARMDLNHARCANRIFPAHLG